MLVMRYLPLEPWDQTSVPQTGHVGESDTYWPSLYYPTRMAHSSDGGLGHGRHGTSILEDLHRMRAETAEH